MNFVVVFTHRNVQVAVYCITFHCLVTVLVCGPSVVSGAESESTFKDGVFVTDSKFYLQLGRSQRISCASLADTSDAVVVFWYNVPRVPDGAESQPVLLVRKAGELQGGNYSAGPRYSLAPDTSLVLKSVVGGDTGTYRCQKVSSTQADSRENDVEVVVLDNEFPAARGVVREGRNITIKRSQRDMEISCPIKEASALRNPTWYWSTEAGGPDRATQIVAQVFSDGETFTADGYRVASSNNLVLPAVASGESLGLWCHVSSTLDNSLLQSARVSLSIQTDSNVGLIVGVLVVAILVLGIIIFLVYWKSAWIKGRVFKDRVRLDGPAITSGSQDEWTLECYLGPNGNKNGGRFASLKTVAIFNDSQLAVLDDNALHTFSPDLAPLHHVTKLETTPDNYVTMATHHDGRRLLLGAKHGVITTVSFDSKRFRACNFSSLSELPNLDGEREDSDSNQDAKGAGKFPQIFNRIADIVRENSEVSMTTGSTRVPGPTTSEGAPLTCPSHELTDLAVGGNGDVYAGDNSSRSIAVFYPEGGLKDSHSLNVPPKRLACSSKGEILVHSGDHASPVRLVKFNGETTQKTVFIESKARIINPVNLFADHGSVFIVSDTKCNGQMEILQFDTSGNYQRQFVKPWPGVRGMRLFASGERLALYDSSVVRMYGKKPAVNRAVTPV